MIGYFDLGLRLTIWFLLTADVSLANIIIGVGVAFLLPRRLTSPVVLKDGLKILGKIILAIPQAYIEAIEMMLWPHKHEVMTLEQTRPNRTPGLIFLDIFLITFTPKTIVTKYHEPNWYQVHRVSRRRKT